MSNLNLLNNLNFEQCNAVTLPSESALVIAGAGCGKTKVLTTRIAWLLNNNLAEPHNILAVTFTNKAANEILLRLNNMLSVNIRNIWIGTFHSLCHRFLRIHFQDAGLPHIFQIIDNAEQLSIIKRILNKKNTSDEKLSPKNLQYFINNIKTEGLRASQIKNNNFNNYLIKVYSLYEKQCNFDGVVDFTELLLRSYELLKSNSKLRIYYQQRFSHILVDEFQDTNNLQYLWLKLLVGNQNAIFAVGDDDQSIYAFRGAKIDNILNFKTNFSVKHYIKLEQNYRSHTNIIDAANTLISKNKHRFNKGLYTNIHSGRLIKVYEASTDQEEANWIALTIRKLINQKNISAKDIAILYRSNVQSRSIEYALINANITYKVYGGLKFFERQEIKHVIAYLRLVVNFNDDNAFLRVVNIPNRGIGNRSLEILTNIAQLNKCSLACATKLVTGKFSNVINNFVYLIKEVCKEATILDLPNLVQYLIVVTGLKNNFSLKKDEERLKNFQELIGIVEAFVIEHQYSHTPSHKLLQNIEYNDKNHIKSTENIKINPQLTPLSHFLSYASLEASDTQDAKICEHNTNLHQCCVVQLMTVHAAKGLEFLVVFIAGLEEKIFPHEENIIVSSKLEEERRLMYVALTRARERLYLSFAHSRVLYGKSYYNTCSRFLNELPADKLEWLNKSNVYSYKKYNVTNASLVSKSHSIKSKKILLPSKIFLEKQYTNKVIDYQVGQTVLHSQFGTGIILHLEKYNNKIIRICIAFSESSKKWFSLEKTKLQVIF